MTTPGMRLSFAGGDHYQVAVHRRYPNSKPLREIRAKDEISLRLRNWL